MQVHASGAGGYSSVLTEAVAGSQIRVGEFTTLWRYDSTDEINFVNKAYFRF